MASAGSSHTPSVVTILPQLTPYLRVPLRRWWRLPLWLLSPLSGAKSFVDNPVLGSRRLNRLGLHAARVRLAHALADRRRHSLRRGLPAELREHFERDGYILLPHFLPPHEFEQLRSRLLSLDIACRSHQQGDTITSRVAIGPDLLASVPQLSSLLRSSAWRGPMRFVSSFSSQPLYYLQAIASGVAEGPPDPQVELHADTFHPSMKAWLFLTDVGPDDSPLTYVAGSHRLTRQRLDWERQRSLDVLDGSDRLSQRGSLRIAPTELAALGLPQPIRFIVPANTLVIVDTCGFHARGKSARPNLRVELWAYCRRTPFLPWTGLDVLSWGPLADRRAQWLAQALDWLHRKGWARQHWQPGGSWLSRVERS